jgi:hypothetical protein
MPRGRARPARADPCLRAVAARDAARRRRHVSSSDHDPACASRAGDHGPRPRHRRQLRLPPERDAAGCEHAGCGRAGPGHGHHRSGPPRRRRPGADGSSRGQQRSRHGHRREPWASGACAGLPVRHPGWLCRFLRRHLRGRGPGRTRPGCRHSRPPRRRPRLPGAARLHRRCARADGRAAYGRQPGRQRRRAGRRAGARAHPLPAGRAGRDYASAVGRAGRTGLPRPDHRRHRRPAPGAQPGAAVGRPAGADVSYLWSHPPVPGGHIR